MELIIWTTPFLVAITQGPWGQTSGTAKLVKPEATAPEPSANPYTVLGATPQQEALVRAQIRIMQPDVYPLRVLFVPHWKYVDTARTFRLHVPVGYTSAMNTLRLGKCVNMALVYPTGTWRRKVLAVSTYFQCGTKRTRKG